MRIQIDLKYNQIKEEDKYEWKIKIKIKEKIIKNEKTEVDSRLLIILKNSKKKYISLINI